MLKILKRKKQFILLLLLLLSIIFSYGQDTTIRKKYLDSVKNQLAAYTVSSYTHLKMYNDCQENKNLLEVDLKRAKQDIEYVVRKKRNQSAAYVISLICLMGLSFFITTKIK